LSNTKVIIEVQNENEFNLGWLLYLMGEDEPSVEDSPDRHDGWAMANETRALQPVRRVFSSGTASYQVSVSEPKGKPEPATAGA
jgi:hypothetical protein